MQTESMNEFTRLELEANIFRPPPVKFKDLEADSTSRIIRDQLKFDYRYDYLRITSDTVLVPITVQIPVRQLSFPGKGWGRQREHESLRADHEPHRTRDSNL